MGRSGRAEEEKRKRMSEDGSEHQDNSCMSQRRRWSRNRLQRLMSNAQSEFSMMAEMGEVSDDCLHVSRTEFIKYSLLIPTGFK